MKKIFILAGIAVAWFTVMADVPAGYYSSLEGKSGVALRNATKAIANGHKQITYSSGTWDAFEQTDVKIVNGRQAWWDMYSNNVVYLPGHSGMNIEHSVAQSWWGGGHNNLQGTDLHQLNPSDADANNRKANYPLGEISGTPNWTNGVTSYGKPVSGQGGKSTYVYEPCDEYKGDFARVFMYMFATYYNISWATNTAWMYNTANALLLEPWAVTLLLKWNEQDPVSEKEIKRNEAVYKIQGNRNPFIDCPHLGEYIWGAKNSKPFYVDESSAVEEIEEEILTPGYDGYQICAPEGSTIFDAKGCRVSPVNPAQGLYIVVSPAGKSAKILVK